MRTELLPGDDQLQSVIQTAGVTRALTDVSVQLERLPKPGSVAGGGGLRVTTLSLEGTALQTPLQDGDVLTLQAVLAAFSLPDRCGR